jgi:hypothetical protein
LSLVVDLLREVVKNQMARWDLATWRKVNKVREASLWKAVADAETALGEERRRLRGNGNGKGGMLSSKLMSLYKSWKELDRMYSKGLSLQESDEDGGWSEEDSEDDNDGGWSDEDTVRTTMMAVGVMRAVRMAMMAVGVMRIVRMTRMAVGVMRRGRSSSS